MFHRGLFKCISSSTDASFMEKSGYDMSNITISVDQSKQQTFSLSKLKKKFNSSNEKISHHLKSKLKAKTKKATQKMSNQKKVQQLQQLQNMSAISAVNFNSSNIMSSTVCSSSTRYSTNLYSHCSGSQQSLNFSGFYSENSDMSDDESDVSFEDDPELTRKYFETTLKHRSVDDESDIDSSFSSIESFDVSEVEESFQSQKFNPLISSSRCDTSIRSVCCGCNQAPAIEPLRKKRRSLASFHPVQTSSRVVLTECPEVSKILSQSNYSISTEFNNVRINNANNVFSSTMITSV